MIIAFMPPVQWVFFMILSLTGRKGLSDLPHFFAPAAASRHPLAHLELDLTSDDARSIMPCDGLGENWRVDTH